MEIMMMRVADQGLKKRELVSQPAKSMISPCDGLAADAGMQGCPYSRDPK
jgi:hypothetical protein